MKDGLENIDKIFKKAFDGFESNVDPSVWNNIQNSIGPGAGSTPQVDPSTVSGIAGKSIAVKIVAGVALVGTVATSVYFIPELFENKKTVITEKIVAEDNLNEATEENEILTNIVDVGGQNEAITEVEIDNIKEEKEVILNNNLLIGTVDVEANSTEGDVKIEESPNTPSASLETNVGSDNNINTQSQAKSDKEDNNSKNTIKVVKKPELLVKMSVDMTKGTAPLEVSFDAYGNAVSYHWDFGDDSEYESEESSVHTFFNEGTYTIKLTGQDSEGNVEDVYQRIIVEKNYISSLEPIKKWFSPNGDNINDIIKFKGKNIAKIDVRVMDSNGNTVYTTKLIDDVWDGKDQNGNYLIQGYYLIVVVAIGTDEKEHVIQQSINLRN